MILLLFGLVEIEVGIYAMNFAWILGSPSDGSAAHPPQVWPESEGLKFRSVIPQLFFDEFS